MLSIILTFPNEYEKSKFDYIYEKYKKLLLHKANGILHDYSLAEDAVSEAFLRVYKNLQKIDDPDSGKTVSFLTVIVRNTALNILNKNMPVYSFDTIDSDKTGLQSGVNVEDEVISEIVADGMIQLVDKLKDELKDCFLLMYAHNLSYKEIGGILNISEENAAVRIHRARKKLISLLKEGNFI